MFTIQNRAPPFGELGTPFQNLYGINPSMIAPSFFFSMIITFACLVLNLTPTLVSADSYGRLWAMKSHGGGGFASHAAYDPIQNKVNLMGVTWNAHFLKRWKLVNDQEDDTDNPSVTTGDTIATDDPLCFVGTIQVPHAGSQTATLSDSNAWRGDSFCQSMTLLKDNTALMLGYELQSNPTNPVHTDSVQRVLSTLSLQTFETKELQISSPTETFSNFAYPMGMMTDAHAKGEAKNVFVALTQGTQVPPMFHLDSMAAEAEDTGAPLSVLQPQFWFRQLQEMVWIRTGRQSSLEASTTGGVQKIDVAGKKSEWYSPLTGEPGYEGNVMATHVAYAPSTRHGEFVLVAGSAKGASGPLLGTLHDRPIRGGIHDWDGFLTKLDPQTGGRATPLSGHDASYRINSGANKDDWVTALCFQNPDTAYIIGSTKGKVASSPLNEDGGAFIIKIDIDDMRIHWKVQLEGMGVLGTACAISEEEFQAGSMNKHLLYVAGVLPPSHPGFDFEGKKDPSASGRHRASQDAFVVAINVESSNGQIEWIREIEYEEEASLMGAQGRHEHIFSLVLDSNEGHVIAFGNSYDPSHEANDVFAVALDGQHGMAGGLAGITREAGGKSSSNSSEEGKANSNEESSDIYGADHKNGATKGAVAAAIVVAVLLALSVVVMHFLCHYRHQKSLHENEKMESISDLVLEHNVVAPDVKATNLEDDNSVPQIVSVDGQGAEPDPPGVIKEIV